MIAWCVGLIWIIPFTGVLVASIRPHSEIVLGWWRLAEIHLSVENYLKAWSHPTAPIGEGVKNSLVVAIPATFLPLLIGAFAAYGFLRLRFPGRDMLFVIIVLLLAIPQQMVAIPLFRILMGMGLLNTFAGLILAHTAWGLPWITLFMRNYMTTLPMELEEAARLDGASRFQIFYKIVLPLTLPALASVAALQLTWVWNDFFMALILLYDPHMLVATQRVPLLRGLYHIDWGILSAASIITMALPVLVFVILQKYYVRGLIGWTLK
jgi:multiple sugar transport system permease protein